MNQMMTVEEEDRREVRMQTNDKQSVFERLSAPNTLQQQNSVPNLRVKITNIHYEVSEPEFQNYLKTIVKDKEIEFKSFILFDLSGRSTEQGIVIFGKEEEVEIFIELFDRGGREFFGREMKCQLLSRSDGFNRRYGRRQHKNRKVPYSKKSNTNSGW